MPDELSIAPLSPPLAALAVANASRRDNDARKARVKAPHDTVEGMAVLAGELESPAAWPKHLTLLEALHWPYRSFPAHRRELLWHGGCSEETKVSALTDRQRVVLCDALRSPVVWRGRAA